MAIPSFVTGPIFLLLVHQVVVQVRLVVSQVHILVTQVLCGSVVQEIGDYHKLLVVPKEVQMPNPKNVGVLPVDPALYGISRRGRDWCAGNFTNTGSCFQSLAAFPGGGGGGGAVRGESGGLLGRLGTSRCGKSEL